MTHRATNTLAMRMRSIICHFYNTPDSILDFLFTDIFCMAKILFLKDCFRNIEMISISITRVTSEIMRASLSQSFSRLSRNVDRICSTVFILSTVYKFSILQKEVIAYLFSLSIRYKLSSLQFLYFECVKTSFIYREVSCIE